MVMFNIFTVNILIIFFNWNFGTGRNHSNVVSTLQVSEGRSVRWFCSHEKYDRSDASCHRHMGMAYCTILYYCFFNPVDVGAFMYISACSGRNPMESSFTPCDLGFNFWQLPPRNLLQESPVFHPDLIKYLQEFGDSELFSFKWSTISYRRGGEPSFGPRLAYRVWVCRAGRYACHSTGCWCKLHSL